jgi:hypothetical protein
MARNCVVQILIATALLAGCAKNPDADLWDCQLAVQKDNAGKDAAAAAERLRDIVVCMDERGYRLDSGKPACLNGSVSASCYAEK